MLHALFIAAIMLAGQSPKPTTIIAGWVVAPPQQQISRPLQVLLLPPSYLELWNMEVQKRLDQYWQQFQPALKDRKEYFAEFSKQAHQDATIYVVNRMLRDRNGNISSYLTETPDGKFEFKNIPFGEYKVLAFGKIGGQDVIWQEVINVRSEAPHFLELKKRVP